MRGQANIPFIFTAVASLVMYILILPVFAPLINDFAQGVGPVEAFVIYTIPFIFFIFLFWRIVNNFSK